MVGEAGPRTPEAVADKPKTVLKQVMEVLKPRTEGKNPDVFLVTADNATDWAEIFLSPAQPTFAIDKLNGFTLGLLEQLKAGIKDNDVHFGIKSAQELGKKGGVIFPSIYCDKRKPEKKEIKRNHVTISIYPNSQAAELALAARIQCDRLPKGFDNKIVWEMTKKQIKKLKLDEVKLLPNNSKIDDYQDE